MTFVATRLPNSQDIALNSQPYSPPRLKGLATKILVAVCVLGSANSLLAQTNSSTYVPIIQASETQQDPVAAVQQPAIETQQQPVADGAPFDQAAANKKQAGLKKKALSAHKTLFFENDFGYLFDDSFGGSYLGDGMKERCLPGGGTYSVGGQFRTRTHSETNMRGLGLTGVDDDFFLTRLRLYGDFQFTDNIRFYSEMIDAESNREDFGPRPIEVNRTDMLNAFFDFRLLSGPNGTLSTRIGRQELLYGAQRTVSPLDWANTRRTFDGASLNWNKDKRSIDAFWTHPVRIVDNDVDSPDRDKEFMGIYSTDKSCKTRTVETYFLRYLNGRGNNNFEYNTLGTRVFGNQGDFLYEFEGAYQFGTNTDGSSHTAGTTTFGLGRKFSQRCWKPTAWLYYDWASGDSATGAGNGYDHNFPLAHKYMGFMDLFGRRNLEDINFQYSVSPTKRLKLLVWYHYFFLATQSDTPYNVNMSAFNGGNLPGSTDLGHEIDFTLAYKLQGRQQLLLGYSQFFAGDYYSTTAGTPYTGDANFFYTQYTINF